MEKEGIPSTPEKRREWIKYQLKIRGLSLAKLGRQHGAARASLSKALLNGSPRWEYVIASAIGQEPQNVWPERYDTDALPIKREAQCEE